jgi:signal recognition particle subunit SRP54
VSLVEKAQQAIDAKDVEAMQEKLLKDGFTLEDFLVQLRQMKKLGPLENLLDMMPGMANVPARVKEEMSGSSGQDFKRTEAIILSMTPKERRHPEVINGSRRRRIALGSGCDVRDVNELLKKFDMARKMTQRLKKQQKRLLRMGRRA